MKGSDKMTGKKEKEKGRTALFIFLMQYKQIWDEA